MSKEITADEYLRQPQLELEIVEIKPEETDYVKLLKAFDRINQKVSKLIEKKKYGSISQK